LIDEALQFPYQTLASTEYERADEEQEADQEKDGYYLGGDATFTSHACGERAEKGGQAGCQDEGKQHAKDSPREKINKCPYGKGDKQTGRPLLPQRLSGRL
jgi:hypothetical protein